MIYTSDASNIVCGHCGGLVKGSCCWMAGKAYHNSCYSLLMGIERGLASVIDKDARIAVLEAERDQLRAALANLKALLRSICEEWNEGCDPACDSFGHTDTCKGANIAQAKRAMRDEIERLRAVVGSIERVAACGTAEAFLGISDDGKRLHFAMSVRDAGRLKKAQEEIERLRAELEESRAKHLDDRLVLEATAKAERLLRGENDGLKKLLAQCLPQVRGNRGAWLQFRDDHTHPTALAVADERISECDALLRHVDHALAAKGE